MVAGASGRSPLLRRLNNCTYWGLAIPFVAITILVLLAAGSFPNTNIFPTAYSDPKGSYAKEGLLTVRSEYKHPIIIATVRGYLNVDGCKQIQPDNSTTDAIATVTILSENGPGNSSTTLFQLDKANPQMNSWETNFYLNISPPSSFEQGDLCFVVYWRVEYCDYESSISDFPSNTSSFRGTPNFHRAWNYTDFNLASGSNVNWLVRRSHEDRWAWSGHIVGNILKDGTRSCPSLLRERDYSIVIIGDSQPFYMCQHLIWELNSSRNIRCVQIKQTLGNSTTFLAYANELEIATENVVIFNPSGLWEAAYGSIDLFRDNFQRLLDHIPSRRKHRQSFFFAPTTAVHPIVYGDLPDDAKKWSMTQVRVREINNIAVQLVLNVREKRVGDTISLRVLPTPIDALSLNREDDPKTPSDMRHFGTHTNEMLMEAILCDLD
jgi:hypothetical protein